ncbi:hypothetical protein SAMN05216188_119130 [Lentzea xinjiangensis]|uniref:Uncharacterized protein n=1 Tax=Lentzea xinjiangensis TaxID=402600 RepID=A0A1H9TXN1_9PSEU|nr:hypothetical protein [Lentzea xinjiangensis]SES01758.1 hypothetical protein SAMN05216188_119130 [Lentzea xinjiangensis]
MGLADRMIRLLWAVGGEDVAERVLRSHWRVLPSDDLAGRALRGRLVGELARELPGRLTAIREAVLVDELSLLDATERAAPSRATVLAIVRALPVGSPS